MAEQMKPSGIDWIKDIPSSWEINKVKYLATEPETLFLDGDWIESDVIEESGIRYLTTGNVGAGFYKEQGSGYISEKTFSELHCLNVYPGDLMISRLNEPIGRACIIPDTESRYVVAVDNVILRPNANYNKKFIMYGMNADGYAEHANMIARGATMSRISRSQLGQFWLAFPNIDEQQAIADYLDKECNQIDSIAADLEKQLALLQQYKKSLITKTVTKGLDNSAPMKDSGIECIGEIPIHWGIKRIKYVSKKIGSGKTPKGGAEVYEDEGIMFIRSQNVYDDGLRLSDVKYISSRIDAEMYNTRLEYGDVLFNITGASIGRCCTYTLSDCGNVNQHVCIIRTNSFCLNEYLRYVLNSDIGKRQTESNQMGGNRDSLTFEQIGQFIIPLPTLEEQQDIVKYLNLKLDKTNSIIKSKEYQLKLIQQHKKSLIYEYVTGKKRVKEVQ